MERQSTLFHTPPPSPAHKIKLDPIHIELPTRQFTLLAGNTHIPLEQSVFHGSRAQSRTSMVPPRQLVATEPLQLPAVPIGLHDAPAPTHSLPAHTRPSAEQSTLVGTPATHAWITPPTQTGALPTQGCVAQWTRLPGISWTQLSPTSWQSKRREPATIALASHVPDATERVKNRSPPKHATSDAQSYAPAHPDSRIPTGSLVQPPIRLETHWLASSDPAGEHEVANAHTRASASSDGAPPSAAPRSADVPPSGASKRVAHAVHNIAAPHRRRPRM